MREVFLSLCGCLLTMLCFVACEEDDDSISKKTTIEVISVRLSQTELIQMIGESHTLTAQILPENATDKSVTWESSNPAVATVSTSGVVKAVSAGTATITATADGKSAACQVTVKQESGGIDANIGSWDENDIYKDTVN